MGNSPLVSNSVEQNWREITLPRQYFDTICISLSVRVQSEKQNDYELWDKRFIIEIIPPIIVEGVGKLMPKREK